MPVWHASVAIIDPRRMRNVPIRDWSADDLLRATRKACALLDGVGVRLPDRDVWDRFELSVQVRRPLADREIARLDPAWLALPAIDGG